MLVFAFLTRWKVPLFVPPMLGISAQIVSQFEVGRWVTCGHELMGYFSLLDGSGGIIIELDLPCPA
jgi:hypothetical protein